jgi:hypothetical protein
MATFNLQRIIKEDFPSKYYDLLDKLLFPLNSMIDSLNNGLTNSLTVAQNLSAQQSVLTVTAPVTSATPFNFKSSLSGPCTGILCINAVPVNNNSTSTTPSQPVTGQPFLTFTNAGSQITITNITNLVSGSTYNLTVYCFT